MRAQVQAFARPRLVHHQDARRLAAGADTAYGVVYAAVYFRVPRLAGIAHAGRQVCGADENAVDAVDGGNRLDLLQRLGRFHLYQQTQVFGGLGDVVGGATEVGRASGAAHAPYAVGRVTYGAHGGLGTDEPLVPTQVSHIARDPLDPAFDDARFAAALARKNTGIKRALPDQTLISGIGNIYADEALWAARIHYAQPANSLSRAKVRTLLAEIRHVLEKALAEGGTSFDAQYVNVNGNSGYFSHSLNAYGRQGEPCPRCGTPIVREQFMNRGSHFCPRCQRLSASLSARQGKASNRSS